MMKSLKRRLALKDISIKTIIFISFIIILLATVAIIGYVTYSSWMNSLNDTIIKTGNILNQQIISEVDIFMGNAISLNRSNQGLIEDNIIDINDQESREKFFVNALDNVDCDEIYSFSYGTELGEYYGARKNKNCTIEIMRNNRATGGHSWYYSVSKDKTAGELVLDAGEFDCRTRPWYEGAKEKNQPVFSGIYKHFILDDLAISSSIPIHGEDGKLQGVLGAHINLSRINDYLEEIVKNENAYAIIIEKESGEIVANSLNRPNFKRDLDGTFGRLPVNEIGYEPIEQAYKNYISSGVDNYQVDYKDDQLHLKLVEYHREGLNWVIITALPNSVMVSSIRDNVKIALILTVLAIGISSIIFYIFTKRYMGPIKDLIKIQEEFAGGDLGRRAVIARNDEIGLLSNSFNMMANTIYDLINRLEQKVEERTKDLEVSNRALGESKDQLQLILDSTAESIYGIDLNGNCTFINDSGVQALGYDDESQLIGKNMHRQIHHSYKNGEPIPIEECMINKALTEGKGSHVNDEVLWRKDGTWFSVEYYSYPQFLEGEVVGAVVTFMDNTHRKKMEEMVLNEKELFKTTLLSVGDGVISTDSKGVITIMNPVAEKLTGWSNQEAIGKPLEEVLVIINECSKEICKSPAKQVLESGKVVEMDMNTILISKNKDLVPIEDSAAPIRDGHGNIAGVVIVFRDCTDKKQKLDRIEYLSMHDQLTGLYNRWYMKDAMRRLDTERNLPFTIMVIDVNGLKLVNDVFGHDMGDRLLKIVSEVLKSALRAEDIMGRVGGDEFLVLLPKTDKIQAKNIKNRILKAISNEKLDSVIISVAIGYSTKKNKDESLKDIRISADNEMYKDKLSYGKIMRSQTIKNVLRNINFKYDEEQIHTERVSQYCQLIAIAMNFSKKEIQEIKTAGLLHDIGKVVVPPELLNKIEKLTDEEFELIKVHPETSYQILRSVDEYAAFATDVLYHHEHWDGSGYPQGLKGEEIPLNSRIIAVADAYEAMTAKRPYKETKTEDEAIAELKRCAGTQFDPDIVKVFIEKVLN